MSFFDRLSNGWQIANNSFKVLKANRQLIVLPVLSGLSLFMLIASFAIVILAASGWDVHNISQPQSIGSYVLMFLFYIVNYFIVVYFNMALVHCCTLYFKGEEVTVRKGLDFSFSRIGAIFSWAVFAGTIGAVLRIIQDNLGSAGKIITGLIGIVWSIATFFVVPVIAYENVGPIQALKRSAELMKQKWGQRLGAAFSFGLITLLGILLVGAVAFALFTLVHPFAGIAFGAVGLVALFAILSATRTIFISAVYHNINGDPVEHFNQQFIDNLFVQKS